MIKLLKEKFNYRIIMLISLWYMFILRIWPLMSIARYNHSNADDYWMSSHMHFTWEDTHSIWETVKIAWVFAVNMWKNWDGCLFSMFIGNLAPVVFHEDYNKITFFILAGSIIFSFFLLLFEIMVRVFKMDWLSFGLICPVMLIAIINFVPSIKDAFFWWVGGINYTLFSAVLFFTHACLIEYMVSKRKVFLVIGTFFSFSVGLGNLLSGLVNPEILIIECVIFIYINKKGGLPFLVPTAAGIVGLLTNVLAPANLVRGGDNLFSNSVVDSIIGTIVASTNFLENFYKPPMFFMFIFICAIIFIFFDTSKINYKFKYPGIFVVFTYLVYCSVFTPVVYVGCAFYGRCINVSFFVLSVILILNIIYIVGWLKNRFNIKSTSKSNEIIVVCMFFFMVMWANVHYYPYYHSAIAEVSLKEGQARDFDAKVDARYRDYYNPDIDVVIIEPIDWVPSIFYFDDSCLNLLAYYFHKEAIRYPDGYEQP